MTGPPRTPTADLSFAATWTAQILSKPPLIAPARQYVLPYPVPGEEDALARGALQILVKPASTPAFLATCALGFRDPVLPSGLWACPRPDDLLAVAGGYGYLVNTAAAPPASPPALHLQPRPITAVLPSPEARLLLLAGFHDVTALGAEGVRWRSARLSWEGVTLAAVRDGVLHGTGWNMRTDRELPFFLDLRNGQHTGGGYP